MLSDNAKTIYEKYYRLPNEKSPSDVHKRVAQAIGNNEKEERLYFKLLENNIFRPNTPCMVNAGKQDGQLCACFLTDLQDSMHGINELIDVAIRIYNSGGGIGIPITNLREKGATISTTNGKASGPEAVIRIIESISEEIKSGGKHSRAANLAVIRYDHPDILDLLKLPLTDKIKKFNISVGVDYTFFESLKNNDKIYFVSPHTGKTDKWILAEDLWKAIIKTAWATGDPGLIFLDTINKYNPVPSEGKIETVNVCVVGDTQLLAKHCGYIKIKDYVGVPVNIWNGFEWTKVTPMITGENQKIKKLTFSNGEILECTEYHRFKLNNGKEIEAKNLYIGAKLDRWNMPVLDDPSSEFLDDEYGIIDPYTQGFFCGDGHYIADRDIKHISLYDKKRNLINILDYYQIKNYGHKILLKISELYYSKEYVPLDTEVSQYSIKWKLEYLAGLCDSDGTITRKSIQITSINFNFLLNVKRMINTLGVDGKITLNKPKQKKYMPDGNGRYKLYNCKNCYRLLIPVMSVKKLIDLGFKTFRLNLNNINPNRDAAHFIKIIKIEDGGIADKVYCFKDPVRGMGMFNNIATMQCGEIPNIAWTVCNLGSNNISNSSLCYFYADNSFSVDSQLIDNIHTAIAFLDSVIDKTSYPNSKFEETTKKLRPIGLGFMGFADFLAKKEIPYNSQLAIKYFEHFCRTFTKESIRASINLVASGGRKPIEIPEKDKKHFRNLIAHYTDNDSNILSQYDEYGIRNSTWTCVAPTGTSSISCDAHFGWEPYFSLLWEKTLQDSQHRLTMLMPTFEELVDRLCMDSFITKDKVIDDLKKNNGSLQGLSYFPEKYRSIFKTAHEIPIKHKIEMQAAGQRYISQAISSTVNLSNGSTQKDISNIYLKAYELGLKGITVFRDGCKDSQVVNFKNKKPDSHITFGKTIKVKTPSGVLKIIGEYTNKEFTEDSLCEIALSLNSSNVIEKEYITTIGELISLMLYNNIPLNDALRILMTKTGDKFWSNIDEGNSYQSILNAIGTIIYNNFNKTKDKIDIAYSPTLATCPECGGIMESSNGCKSGICNKCGYSKCG